MAKNVNFLGFLVSLFPPQLSSSGPVGFQYDIVLHLSQSKTKNQIKKNISMTNVKFGSGSLMMTRIMFSFLKENIKKFMQILWLKRKTNYLIFTYARVLMPQYSLAHQTF